MEDYPSDRVTSPELPQSLRPGEPSRGRPARQPEREEIDLRGLLSTVWRRKGTISIFGFGLAFLAMAASYAMTPRYEASSTVMLNRQDQQFIDLDSVVSGVTPDFFMIPAEVEVLRSRALARRVVEAENLTEHPYFNPDLAMAEDAEPGVFARIMIGAIEGLKSTVRGAVTEEETLTHDVLDPDYYTLQSAIDILLESSTVTTVGDTYVYMITVETEDPVQAAAIADRYANVYLLDQLETKFEATQAATEWLDQRLAELKEELEASESAVESFNSSATLVSEQALAALGIQLKDLRDRREELQALSLSTNGRFQKIDAAVEANDLVAAAELSGSARLRQLAARLPTLDDDEATAAKARFDAGMERARAQIAAEGQRATAQFEAVSESIVDLEAQFETQTADLVKLRQLMREAEANRRIYEQFLRRLNETSVQQGVQQADARILSPAVIDFSPSFPNKVLIVLTAGFFGGLVGIAFVVFAEQMNRAFRTAEELEADTGLPVLGSIPVAPVRTRRNLLGYANSKPSSAIMEAVRNLRTGILLANVDSPPKVVMLTSSLPKEGKTTSSVLLAKNAAALGKRVLLVECDLRRRILRSYFDVESRDGLMSVLTGEKSFDEAVHHDETSGLDLIVGDETKTNAADVFSSKRFASFVEEAREKYDFVVIDTPPVLAVPDARVIAPLSDAVIYCVRWNYTHRDLVRDGLGSFEQIRVRVAGLALTQINLKHMARYGYGGYRYYYYRSSSRYYVN